MQTWEDVARGEVFLADVRPGLIITASESRVAVAPLNRAIGINASYPTRMFDWAPKPDEYPVVASRGAASRPRTGRQPPI